MKKISKEQQSILAILAGLLAGAWISHNYSWLIAAGIVAITLPFPVLHTPIHKGWMMLSNVLGFISRHVILFVLFFLFLTPLAFLMKIFGKKNLLIKIKDGHSVFNQRAHLYTSRDFNNPW